MPIVFQENFTGFTAAGFSPTPGAGQLDSDVWRVAGASDNLNPAFGFTAATGDFARGVLSGDPTTGGVYALNASTPTFGAALVLQPSAADFDSNGFIELRIQNTTGATLTNITVDFDWVYRNNADRASSMAFSFSGNGSTFTSVPDGAFTTPQALQAGATFVADTNTGLTLTGLSVNAGDYIYLRWTHQNAAAGSGSRDEIGIDNVVVNATQGGGGGGSTISIDDVTIAEGDSGTTIATFTISRTGGTEAFSVDYATAPGTATSGADYVGVSGVVNFGVGETSRTVTVTINGDTDFEANETYFVNLTNATNGVTIGDAQGLGTIGNDDAQPPSVTIDDVTVTEANSGVTVATFTVTRSGGTGAFSVDFATANGTGTAGSDYVANSGTLNFGVGELTKTIAVTINGDTASEPDETFFVNLTNPTGGAVIADAQGQGTIANDDGSHFFQENFTGFTAAGFAPTPGAGQLDSDIWVVTGFSDGASPAFGFTGAAGTDFGRGVISGDPVTAGIYATAAGTPTFGAGLLYQPTGGEGDNDGAIVARLQNTTAQTLTNFTVGFDWIYRNTGDRSSALVFEYSTNGTSWTTVPDGAFATPAAQSGQTVLGDTNTGLTLGGVILNPDDYVYLRWRHDLSTGSGNRDEVGIDNVVVDASPVTGGVVGISSPTVTEGDAGTKLLTFTVTRTGQTDGDFTVDFATANGTASAGSDYVAQNGTLHFTPGGPNVLQIQVVINGDTAFEANEAFTVTLSNLVNNSGAAVIQNGGVGTGTIVNDDVSIVKIYDVQGASHTSPLLGAHLTTEGVVTAVDTTGSLGFWIQDAAGDGNDATSDAVFVFTGTMPTVAVGQFVRVEGTVGEFNGGVANNLTITEIESPIVTVVSSGNPLPAAVVLGAGGRLIPTSVIDNDNFSVFDPQQDAIDFYESLEGMRVTLPNAQATGPTTGNATWAVGDLGANATGMNAAGGITVSAGDFNPERVQIFYDTGVSPPGAQVDAVTGDHLGDVTGIMTYFGGQYELIPTAVGSTGSGPVVLPKESTTLRGDAEHITVGALNVENLDPTDPQAKFDALAANIVANLGAPDIVGLEEVQDADGAGAGTNYSGQATAAKLIAAIQAAGGPAYVYVEIAPTANNQNGGEANGNIRQGYLYNPDRVGFVSVSQITDTTPANGDTYANSRKPLVGVFTFQGEQITLIDVHNTSRLGSEELFGAHQPATNAGDDRRTEQTSFIKTYVEGLVAADPDARVVVMGDFNAFQFETSVAQLESGGALTNLAGLLAVNERYSYNFDGNNQLLDHMLASPELYAGAQFDLVHINSNQAVVNQTSDHDGSVARFFINFDPSAVADSATVAENQSVTINVLSNDTDRNAGDTLTLVSVTPETAAGHASIVNGKVVYVADGDAADALTQAGTIVDTITYQVKDSHGAISTGTVSVTVRGVANAPTRNGTANADTLNGTALDDLINGLGGNDKLTGGVGTDTLNGGLGNDTLSGGVGVDRFVFSGDFGKDVITDWESKDVIQLDAGQFANFAFVQSHAADVGGNVVITLDATHAITIQNTTVASLQSNDFLFV
ncbi:MAG: endonuclease/exonuclease/phosphatase family protein [Phenylobacterium sp.]|uniref:Calx-beta domain-containing protein n=1 Tax=Phenylobacterium sp. TaxID=1871053 RepID=UPI001A580C66|nr:Calx-beta domain-containing protein [Phenylobacterium sp.]MBL8555420.1 endonuclease/exonuclease/phosphatase family protein [Phenylobacterium sp.]